MTAANQAKASNPHSLRWLHISDIHFWGKKEWRDGAARAALLDMLRDAFADGELPKPDLIFCTGDIAQGTNKAAEIRKQYASAKTFFQELLKVCDLQPAKLFVVPGNHDVNRSAVSPKFQDGLRNAKFDDIKGDWASANRDFSAVIKRLNEYDKFIRGFLPQQSDKRHCYNNIITHQGYRIGIAGFNSAWSCYDDQDENQLWLAAEWQFNQAHAAFTKQTDLRIGLIHHPITWLKQEEEDLCKESIRAGFHFWLHGHEHSAWVTPTDREICISAGAVNANTENEFGINLVELDLLAGKGKVHLYSYQTSGSAWLVCPSEDARKGVRAIVFKPISPSFSHQEDTDTATEHATDARANAGSAIEKFSEIVAASLQEPQAQPFKQALCRELKIATTAENTPVPQILAALDASPLLQEQMFCIQRAVRANPIPEVNPEATHPIENAAGMLYMRAAMLAVRRDVSEVLKSDIEGVSFVPQKSDALIAVLVAAHNGEHQDLKLETEIDAQKMKAIRTKGKYFIDLDELPQNGLKIEEAIEQEAAIRLDKNYSTQAGAVDCELVKMLAEQQREVLLRHYRFVVSHTKSDVLQDDAICGEQYQRLGIPFTKVLDNAQVDVKALLGISISVLDGLFRIFLESIQDAKRRVGTS